MAYRCGTPGDSYTTMWGLTASSAPAYGHGAARLSPATDGCQLVRPYCDSDQQQTPTHMEEVLKAAGIPTVEYALKTKCCGGSLTGNHTDRGQRLNYIILKEAIRKGRAPSSRCARYANTTWDAYQADIRKI